MSSYLYHETDNTLGPNISSDNVWVEDDLALFFHNVREYNCSCLRYVNDVVILREKVFYREAPKVI